MTTQYKMMRVEGLEEQLDVLAIAVELLKDVEWIADEPDARQAQIGSFFDYRTAT